MAIQWSRGDTTKHKYGNCTHTRTHANVQIYVAGQNREVNGVYNQGVFGLDNIRYLNPNVPPEAGSELPHGSACVNPSAALTQRKSALRRRLFARRFSRHV